MTVSRFARIASGFALCFVVACEGESKATGPITTPTGPALNQIVSAGPLNASSVDTLVYYSFASGTLVRSSEDWDIALRRFEIRLNGGISGTKGVLGYSLDNNKTATTAQLLALTPAGTLDAFDAVRESSIPGASTFKADRLVENNVAYLNLAGAPTANAALYWKLKTADGGYAVVRVTAITFNATFSAVTSVTIDSRLQTGSVLGAVRTVTVPFAGAPVSISVVTNGSVTPSGCNWDLQINPDVQSLAMTTNATCNVGTYPGATSTPAFSDVTTASDAPQYGAFLSAIGGAIPNDYTTNVDPFRYNLQNDNRLTPTFNTYLIMTGTNVYKLQVINYYSDAGASGFPTIRYAKIR